MEIVGENMSDALKEKANAELRPLSFSASIVVNGGYIPSPQDNDGKIWVRLSALVIAEPNQLYGMWREGEIMPLWQEQITDMTRTGDRASHWTMHSGERTIEWGSEVVADERRVAWRSINGDSASAGEVVFDPAPGGRGTIVTVLQKFPVRKLASDLETAAESETKQAVIENLRHFKALAETGEVPRTQGRPHDPRGR